MDVCFHIFKNESMLLSAEIRWNVTAEQVFDKLWTQSRFCESETDLIYLDVHDAVLAAVKRDAMLRQQVPASVHDIDDDDDDDDDEQVKVKFSYTRYRALGPELITGKSARRWLEAIHPAVGCHYFLPGLRLPSQPKSVTAHRRYQIILLGDRGTCVWAACPKLLPGSGPAEIRTRDLHDRERMLYH